MHISSIAINDNNVLKIEQKYKHSSVYVRRLDVNGLTKISTDLLQVVPTTCYRPAIQQFVNKL